MKIFIYKLIISLILFYLFFELTIGSRIDYIAQKINIFSDHQSRLEIKEKLKDEMKKAVKKESYFTEEERLIISNFIKKLKKELDLENNN